MDNETRRISPLLIAGVIGLVILTVAVWTRFDPFSSKAPTPVEAPPPNVTGIRDVDATDHVFGNPNAYITFVVYADYLCPFCRDYHNTMRKVIEEYGKEGEVAFVFRHMPITSLHPESPTYALASECVAQAGGNKAFWDFTEMLYATVTPEVELDSQVLTNIAVSTGVSAQDFKLCMRSSNLMTRVEKDFNEALDAGASATPYTIIVTPHQKIQREGSRSYAVVAGTVQSMLRNLVDERNAAANDGTLKNLFDDSGDEGATDQNSTRLAE